MRKTCVEKPQRNKVLRTSDLIKRIKIFLTLAEVRRDEVKRRSRERGKRIRGWSRKNRGRSRRNRRGRRRKIPKLSKLIIRQPSIYYSSKAI